MVFGTIIGGSSPSGCTKIWFIMQIRKLTKNSLETVVKKFTDRWVDVVSLLNPASVQGPGRDTETARMLLKALNGDKQILPNATLLTVSHTQSNLCF